MNSDIAISVENLSKRYYIQHQKVKQRNVTLRDVVTDTAKSLTRGALSRLRGGVPGKHSNEVEEFWALRDVNFEIKQGEVVGIIGRNGAGKSTLLKILSRITEPTSGRVKIKGRVASLLEVGTGFHPELTGRENIFLNGAILGMSRAEIKKKFDEMVAFAEVEKFLDTPVKRYSSGMYVRLAFAVAAHLEPEILIVDEVLAVGDAAFQKKCLGKMQNVAEEQGRTVLFVSHNMHAVAILCSDVLWLEGGRVKSFGAAKDEVAQFTRFMLAPKQLGEVEGNNCATVRVNSISFHDAHGERKSSFDQFEAIHIRLDIEQKNLPNLARFVLRLRHPDDGSVILATTDWDFGKPLGQLGQGNYTIECEIPGNLLNAGNYFVSIGIDEPRGPVLFRMDNPMPLTVSPPTSYGDGIFGERDGFLSPFRKWRRVLND